MHKLFRGYSTSSQYGSLSWLSQMNGQVVEKFLYRRVLSFGNNENIFMSNVGIEQHCFVLAVVKIQGINIYPQCLM